MADFEANPFADPFKDGSVTQATNSSTVNNASIEEYNPFANSSSKGNIQPNEPAMMQPTNPPAYEGYGTNVKAPEVPPPAPQPPMPGHEELLRRQEELERKAEELQRREQQLASGGFQPRQNNWPPFPTWFPIGPCFYQDFSVDIPLEFQSTVKMIYYLWIYYVIALFLNMLVSLVMFAVPPPNGAANTGGQIFGLALLWMLLFAPCSLCWYRPVYKAFRSDSSFNFFLFFFMMFFQACVAVVMAIGPPGAGYVGWIVAFEAFSRNNVGIDILVCFQAVVFTVMATLSIFLLKRVHSMYRTTGASFEKAQQEFATDVMKNPGVQSAAATAANTAVQSQFGTRQ